MTDDELGQIFREYWSTVWGYISDMGFTAEAAEDLASAVFVKLVKHRNNIDPEKVRAWLYKVARTTVIDHARMMNVRPQPCELTEVVRNRDRWADPFYYTSVTMDLEQISEECELSDSGLDVIVAAEIAGYSRAEIAEMLGKTTSALGVQRMRSYRACSRNPRLNNSHQNDII